MEAFSSFVKVSVPKYLQSLPIPNTFGGFAKLTGEQWFALLPFCVTVLYLLYVTVQSFLPKKRPLVNESLRKDNPKVVDMLEIEDLAKEKISYCRCWRSKKWPYCDGSHNEHNKTTGDNVGPFVLKKKDDDD